MTKPHHSHPFSLTSSRHWRSAPVRYGCARSRDFLRRFPDLADRSARAAIEAGSGQFFQKPKLVSKGGTQ